MFRALLLGLATDNVLIAIGNVAIHSDWYASLSVLRFVAHVVLLPPMLWVSLVLLQRAGSRVARTGIAVTLTLAFVAAGIAYGFVTEIRGLVLVPETVFGHSRLVSAHGGLPIATIVTNLLVIVLAGWLWRIGHWPWLFVTGLTIFLVNGASAGQAWGIIAGNLAEILFALGWLMSLRRFPPD